MFRYGAYAPCRFCVPLAWHGWQQLGSTGDLKSMQYDIVACM
ncbi:hypothetical protein [Anaplasma phagocytophilum]